MEPTATAVPSPTREEFDAVWRRGVELFERARYYECHEVLELLWKRSQGLEKRFLAGAILLASSLHKAHMQRNPRAARVIYARALYHLAWIADTYRGVDVREFERRVLMALPHPGVRPKVPLETG